MYTRCRREVHTALTKSSCCYLYDTTARQMCGFFHSHSESLFFLWICTLPIVSSNFRSSFRYAASNLLTLGSFKINQDLQSFSVHSFYLGGILWGHLNQSFSCFASTDVQHHSHRGLFNSAHLANFFFFCFVSRDTFFPVAIIWIRLSYAPF